MGSARAMGFVAPTTSFDRMRSIDAAATSLQGDFARNVASGDPTRVSFENWLATVWRPFFEKTQAIGAKLAELFMSDELAANVEIHRKELEGFQTRYAQLRNPSGVIVPPSSEPIPDAPSNPISPAISVGLDSGAKWIVGGILVVALGYLAYKTVGNANREAKEARHELFDMFSKRKALPA